MTINQIEKIEKFLGGEMNPDEQERFRQELESDRELLAAYNTYVDVETHMLHSKKYADENAVKSNLGKLGAEFFNSSSRINNSATANRGEPQATEIILTGIPEIRSGQVKNFQLWKLAAAIFLGVIATGTGYIFMNRKNIEKQVVTIPAPSNVSAGKHKNVADTVLQMPPNISKHDTVKNSPAHLGITEPKLLFAKYFSPDTVPTNRDEYLEDAFVQYERRQYKNAAVAFENAESDLSARGEETDKPLATFYASYYKALSFMAIQKEVKAITELKQLTGPDALLQLKVTWYLSLCYIRTGKEREAMLLLTKISKNNVAGDYKLKAGELINELQKLQ